MSSRNAPPHFVGRSIAWRHWKRLCSRLKLPRPSLRKHPFLLALRSLPRRRFQESSFFISPHRDVWKTSSPKNASVGGYALRRWGRFARNIPSGEERGETDVFAGYEALTMHNPLFFCERFEPKSHFISRLSMIVRVNVVLNRTVVVDSDWRFDNLCGSHDHLQSHWSLQIVTK